MYVKVLVSYINWFEKFDLYRYRRKFVMQAIMRGRVVVLQYFRTGRFYAIVTIIINCFSKVLSTGITGLNVLYK